MAEPYGKTPVSILQEYLVSQNKFPYYELTKNGVGTHNPEFIYCVKVGNLTEEGAGRSKQEAKHKAAEKMLKALNVGNTVTRIDNLGEDSKLDVNENHVGQLKELCIFQNYPEPKYTLEESAGPPHSKIFKIMCSVSQLHEYGVCRTKKSAKHKAAHKMLERLQVLVNENNSDHPMPKQIQKIPEIFLNDDEIVEKYESIKPMTVSVAKNSAAYFKDHQKAYIGLQEASPKLSALLALYPEISAESFYTLINEIAEELNVSVTITKIPLKEKPNINYEILTMTVVPPISGMGINKEEAANKLLESLIILCQE